MLPVIWLLQISSGKYCHMSCRPTSHVHANWHQRSSGKTGREVRCVVLKHEAGRYGTLVLQPYLMQATLAMMPKPSETLRPRHPHTAKGRPAACLACRGRAERALL